MNACGYVCMPVCVDVCKHNYVGIELFAPACLSFSLCVLFKIKIPIHIASMHTRSLHNVHTVIWVGANAKFDPYRTHVGLMLVEMVAGQLIFRKVDLIPSA